MTLPSDSRELSSASELEEASKVPSVHGDGSISLTDDEGWPTCSSRSRCRRPKWTREEEMVLVEAHCTLGNAWVAIAECLPGRTPSEVKNIWHSTLRARKLETRSMLRAYVTALKDRADKPAARQQAMRAAQTCLSETAGGDVFPPGKRTHKRSAAQQQQQHQPSQVRTRDTCGPPPPATASTSAPAAGAGAGAGAGPKPTEQDDAGAAGTQALRRPSAGAGADAAAFTSVAAFTLSAGATPTADTRAAAAAAAGAAAAAAPTSGHRSSLGSEWSTVSSGAQEPCHPSAGGHSATATATVHLPSGPSSGDFTTATATPPQVLSFSPTVSPASSIYALQLPVPSPAAAAANPSGHRASAGALVTLSTTGGRVGSPAVQHSHSPAAAASAAANFKATLPHSLAAITSGSGSAAAVSTATCGGGSGGGEAASSPGWLVPYVTSTLADATDSQLVMRQQQATAPHGWGQGHGLACSSATQMTWEPGSVTPATPPGVAAHAADSCSGSGGDTRSLWAGVSGRALMSPTGAHPGTQAAPLAVASSGATIAASGCPAASKQPFAVSTEHTTAMSGSQFRGAVPIPFSGLGNGPAATNSGSDGAGIGIVTMGLYGIMDEELLACIGA